MNSTRAYNCAKTPSDTPFLTESALMIPVFAPPTHAAVLAQNFAEAGHGVVPIENAHDFLLWIADHEPPVAVASLELLNGNCEEVLNDLGNLDDPPNVILLAEDTTKWPGLLLTGAYDVLPADASSDVFSRSVRIGRSRWEHRRRNRIAIAAHLDVVERELDSYVRPEIEND